VARFQDPLHGVLRGGGARQRDGPDERGHEGGGARMHLVLLADYSHLQKLDDARCTRGEGVTESRGSTSDFCTERYQGTAQVAPGDMLLR
jgi:hypothetical protein